MAEPQYPGTPQWVKVFALAALVIVLLLAVIVVTTALGLHTPGVHGPAPTH